MSALVAAPRPPAVCEGPSLSTSLAVSGIVCPSDGADLVSNHHCGFDSHFPRVC